MYFSYTAAQNHVRTLTQGVTLTDNRKLAGEYRRNVTHTVRGTTETGHTAEYLRGLFVEAGSIAETRHEGEYYRKVQDTAGSTGASLRHLFIFLRLLTGAYIRDYIIGRFLRSKEELVLKSPVYWEIIIDSTLH
jgi:hypothetical protein